MFEKSFISDCEGPLTLNDNAFEICNYFLDSGSKFFSKLSLYDDYLVENYKDKGYLAGNTLRFIYPFLLNEGLSNQDLIDFSIENISLVPGSLDTLSFCLKSMNSYIVSTSYSQYIKAVSNFMDFPFENTYYSKMNLDNYSLSKKESIQIEQFKDIIFDVDLESKEDINILNNIFFKEIPKMDLYSNYSNIEIVGGLGKKLAIEDIINNKSINKNQIFYIGDSITDVEPLEFARLNGGVSVSFNGNQYPLKYAEIAVISPHTIATSLLAEIYCKYDKKTLIKFVNEYNEFNNLNKLFSNYSIINGDDFLNIFDNEDYPVIKIINEKNYNEILDKSSDMRNNIRGQDIGALG